MYAIVDIESTGGKHQKERITEIAIYRFDGSQVIDRFASLINPQSGIDPFVQRLTGITPNMLRSAPKFHEVAKRIVEITEGCILVGHGVAYDYSMLRKAFAELGYDFHAPTLDTIYLAKQILEPQPAYSLGKICKNLGIIHTQAHRALGDATATLELFKILISLDTQKLIQKATVLNKKSSAFQNLWKDLPTATGVYYFLDENKKIIYIGKSRNIRYRVQQHLQSTAKKTLRFRESVQSVTYELTGSEWIALIKESAEIVKNKPLFNRRGKKEIFPYGLYADLEQTNSKPIRLFIQRCSTAPQQPLVTFDRLPAAKNFLFHLTEKYQLCQKMNGLYPSNGACFGYSVKECFGVCAGDESPESYNERVKKALNDITLPNKNLLLVDFGREIGEYSFIFICNGKVLGYGFFKLFNEIKTMEKIRKRMVEVTETYDIRMIIRRAFAKNKFLKVIELP